MMQVFQNLIINALQALPPQGGRIVLAADNIRITEGNLPPLAPGNYVAFEIRDNGVRISDAGLDRLEELCERLSGVWRGPRRREQLVRQALSALHVFRRDKHYLLREGKVVIIDENTGRLMPDRSWEQGLHQLIELKEGCEVTGRRETLARISYQRFFRRYVHLAGMTGTASEVAPELWAVYRLRVAKIPTNKPSRRARHPDRIYGSSERSGARWSSASASCAPRAARCSSARARWARRRSSRAISKRRACRSGS